MKQFQAFCWQLLLLQYCPGFTCICLVHTTEFDIKKEAAWALSNATSGGTHEQIKYLVHIGCIKPLCELLVCSDVRIVTVALEGLENILKVGSPPISHPIGFAALSTCRQQPPEIMQPAMQRFGCSPALEPMIVTARIHYDTCLAHTGW